MLSMYLAAELLSGASRLILVPSGRFITALRKSGDLVVDTGLAGRFVDFLQGSVRLSVPDVLHDRPVEDVVLLQDQADILSEIMRVPFPKVHPVQGNGTAIRLIELVQQVHDGRFARSAQADKGRDLSAVP